MIAQVPSTRYQPSRREISALLLTMQGEEVTANGMAAFFVTMEPIIHFIHFGGQRWKDPNKLTKNDPVSVMHRVHVLTYMLLPGELGFSKHVELAHHLGVTKSLVMRHIKDFNVAFGIYSPSQKRVSAHGDIGSGVGTYVEAGKRSHETRRRREAERAAAEAADED